MRFTILTLFPDMVRTVLGTSMLDRAAKAGTVEFEVVDLRPFGVGPHHSVDDTPYGGGAGMLLRLDVVDRALSDIITHSSLPIPPKIILLTPQGKTFNQQAAESMASGNRDLILIAGHYEGFDERIRALVDAEISIGDFVVTGGELPALMIVDAVTRLLPGSLGSDKSVKEESFSMLYSSPITHRPSRLLEYPHYTRPDQYQPISRASEAMTVPDILKSGDHAKIAAWRLESATQRTHHRRPDLMGNE